MVAFFPNIPSESSGWKLASKINEPENNSITSSPHPPEFDSQHLDHARNLSEDHPDSTKKLIHNKYERDRRQKLSSLYSSLRNLLPEEDQSLCVQGLQKKLSIPITVARVLKYIPELQSHIEELARKKEEILLRMSKQEGSSSFTSSQEMAVGPVISATCLSGREVMVQICIKNRSEMIPFSKVVKILEEEGLQLMNASTLAAYADGTFYSLHLQAKDVTRVEGQDYCMHLISTLKKQATMNFTNFYA